MDSEQYLSVSVALKLVDGLLEPHYLYLEGEVTSYTAYPYGAFLTVKDEQVEAVANCFLPKGHLTQPLEKGMKVQMGGRFKTFAKYGKLNFEIDQYQLSGAGSLERAFQLLIEKLTKESLIDPTKKRALPYLPQKVGVISSKDAAGFGDFMLIVRERVPGLKLYFYNVPVQGIKAPEEVIKAFDYLNEQYDLDAIVLLRGGGSLEELQAFNHEGVARAIARSKAPVLTGIGHERDVTIADMVADVRAATPTNAAQILLPTQKEVEDLIAQILNQIQQAISANLNQLTLRLNQSLHQIALQVERVIAKLKTRVDQIASLSALSVQLSFKSTQEQLEQMLRRIELLSPQATLKRGFSITLDQQGRVLRSSRGLIQGSQIITQLEQNQITSTFNSVIDKS